MACDWFYNNYRIFITRGDSKNHLVQLNHFIDENTKAQNKKLTCLRSQLL